MSDTPKMDKDRRTWLIASTAVGGCGAAAALYPFVDSFQPSERAKAAGAPVEVDISGMKPDEIRTVEWRGKPVYVLRRTAEQVSDLATLNGDLKDPLSEASAQPAYISGEARALNEELLVIVGLCTHLGCAPKFRPEVGAADMGGDEWLGGFFCPCHGSKFDLAGRVYKGVPASANLEVPPYSFEGENVLVIGVDAEAV